MNTTQFDFEENQLKFIDALLSVDRINVHKILTQPQSIKNPIQSIEKIVVPSLEKIGIGWESGQYSLSQVYMSGRICEEVVEMILPPNDPARHSQPKTAIVVLEDYHMLGSRIVFSALRSSGFALLNYGRLTVEETIDRVINDQIKILLISVLMLPSALHIARLRERLIQKDYEIKIGVGGAPFRFDNRLWQEVGADAMGNSASEAVEMINTFIRGEK